MKTLTVAELRYALAQLPPEFEDKPVVGSVMVPLEDGAFTVVGVTWGTDLVILNLN